MGCATVTIHKIEIEERRALRSPSGVAPARFELGRVAYTQGDDGQAKVYFTESLRLYQDLGDKLGVADSLVGLAGVAEAQGKLAWAARLLGAAVEVREMTKTPLRPLDRGFYDRTVAALRAALADEAFAAAWSDGRVLTLEQAIAYALADDAESRAGGEE